MFHKFVLISILFSIKTNANLVSKYDWLDLNRTTVSLINFVNPSSSLSSNQSELIESRNFKSETHFITTSDGYILQIFRIINPLLINKTKSLKPLILQHGFLDNSNVFLISRKGYLNKEGQYIEDGTVVTDCTYDTKFGKTLGFVLSACGYDVWLSNIRGNKYTTNHTTLDPKGFHFWRFSLDHFSQIDLPAIINYIGVRTKNQRIGYIGYSMGTTLMFQLMSAQLVYSSIIDPFIAIAPVVYISKVPRLFLKFRYLYPLLRAFPTQIIRSELMRKILINLFGEHEYYGQNEFVKKMMAHCLDQSSTLVLSHFLEIMANNRFAKFDWGIVENLVRYGSVNPPRYILENITSNRIALIQTKNNDMFSDFRDLLRLKNELKVNLLMDYWIPDKIGRILTIFSMKTLINILFLLSFNY